MKAIPVYIVIAFAAMFISDRAYAADGSSETIPGVQTAVRTDQSMSGVYDATLPDESWRMSKISKPSPEKSFKESPLDLLIKRVKRFTNARGTLYTERRDGTGYPGDIKLALKVGYPNKARLRVQTCPYGVCLTLTVKGRATPDPSEVFDGAWFRIKIPLN